MKRNYRYMTLRTLLGAANPVTFLQMCQFWALNSHHEANELMLALDGLVADGTVKRTDNGGSFFNLARPLTPDDYNAAISVTI